MSSPADAPEFMRSGRRISPSRSTGRSGIAESGGESSAHRYVPPDGWTEYDAQQADVAVPAGPISHW